MSAETNTLLAVATVTSTDGFAQTVRTGRHAFTSDEPVALGGTDSGPAPFQLLLGSLGACTAITLRMYAKRKGWQLGELTVKLKMTGGGADEHVDRVVHCTATPEQRTRLLEIAAKTPVTLVLLRAMRIETTFAEG